MTCRDGLGYHRQVILFSVGASNQKIGEQKFRAFWARFWLPALDPDNRLRYPPVSLLRDMCWWLWLGRGVPEQFLEVRFCRVKVGFVVQKSHAPEILKMQNVACTCSLVSRLYNFPALPGAARCALASPFDDL